MKAKKKIFENILKSSEDEYADLISAFDKLDSKAQHITGFSGLILGLFISLFRKDFLVFLKDINDLGVILCLVAVLLFLLSIISSILSIRIMRYTGMPSYEELEIIFNDVSKIKTNNINDDEYLSFLSTKIRMWKDSIFSINSINNKKARTVFIAQLLCGLGLLIFGILGVFVLKSHL